MSVATLFINCVTITALNGTVFVEWKLFHTCPANREINTKKMNTISVKGNWNEQKGKLKQKFAVLTDNDLIYEEGRQDEMYGKLQIKLGKTKEELRKIISEL